MSSFAEIWTVLKPIRNGGQRMFKKGHKPYIVSQVPRCKPPVDCFKCKYSDCIAGENRRPNAEETAFFEAGFGDRRKSCERK